MIQNMNVVDYIGNIQIEMINKQRKRNYCNKDKNVSINIS